MVTVFESKIFPEKKGTLVRISLRAHPSLFAIHRIPRYRWLTVWLSWDTKKQVKFLLKILIQNHHHHVALVARISLTISRHSSLSFIALGRSSGQHPVSSHSCWMYVRAGRPAFSRPCVGVHKSTSLMSLSLSKIIIDNTWFKIFFRISIFLIHTSDILTRNCCYWIDSCNMWFSGTLILA